MKDRLKHIPEYLHGKYKNRQTGRSYRTCLQTVLFASEHPNQKVFAVFPTHSMARCHFYTMRQILSPVYGTLAFSDLRVELPNGSTISCIADSEAERYLPGVPSNSIFWDHVLP